MIPLSVIQFAEATFGSLLETHAAVAESPLHRSSEEPEDEGAKPSREAVLGHIVGAVLVDRGQHLDAFRVEQDTAAEFHVPAQGIGLVASHGFDPVQREVPDEPDTEMDRVSDFECGFDLRRERVPVRITFDVRQNAPDVVDGRFDFDFGSDAILGESHMGKLSPRPASAHPPHPSP